MQVVTFSNIKPYLHHWLNSTKSYLFYVIGYDLPISCWGFFFALFSWIGWAYKSSFSSLFGFATKVMPHYLIHFTLSRFYCCQTCTMFIFLVFRNQLYMTRDICPSLIWDTMTWVLPVFSPFFLLPLPSPFLPLPLFLLLVVT